MWTAVAEHLDGATHAAAAALAGRNDLPMANAAVTAVAGLLAEKVNTGLMSLRDAIKYARKQAKAAGMAGADR